MSGTARGRRFIETVVLFVTYHAYGVVGRLTRRRTVGDTGRVVVWPSDAPGSVGDATCVQALAAVVRSTGSDWELVEHAPGEEWGVAPAARIDGSRFRFAVFAPSAYRRLLGRLSGCRAFIVLGADCVDGRYSLATSVRRLRLMRSAAQQGIPVSLASFSLSTHVPWIIRHAARRLPASVGLTVRDELSRGRAEEVFERTVACHPDIAFAYSPAQGERPMSALDGFLGRALAAGRPTVAVNLNREVLLDRSPEAVHALCTSLAEALAEAGVAVVVTPHDVKPPLSDVEMAGTLAEHLSSRGVPVMELTAPDPAAIAGVVERVDLLVTGRMHLAIAAARAGTPFISITYADKFEGLYDLLGVERLLVDPVEALDPGRLLALLEPSLASPSRGADATTADPQELAAAAREHVTAVVPA